jgi:hypothetical protein
VISTADPPRRSGQAGARDPEPAASFTGVAAARGDWVTEQRSSSTSGTSIASSESPTAPRQTGVAHVNGLVAGVSAEHGGSPGPDLAVAVS